MPNAVFTPTIPHFFQPLLPGFHHHLSIPLSFFKCYLKDRINCEGAVLRSHGRTWSVKIKDRRFEDGWEEFVRDHDLHVGDFVVFGYGGNMAFDVVVFDTSACQRQYPPFATRAKDQNTREPRKKFRNQHEKRTRTSVSHDSPYFVVTMSPDNQKHFRVNIPKKFASSNDLMGRTCETIVVDEQRRSWTASIRHKESDGQVYIGSGWRNICIGNNLKEKDCVLLELIGKGDTPIFKLKVASDFDAKRFPNDHDSDAGCSGGSTTYLD